jgi:hypothetical protein
MATWACWAAATAALVVAMAPSRRTSAEPDPPRIELRWQAPDECPDALAMTHAIEGFLGQPMSAVRAQALSIRAHVLGDAAHGYAGKLSIRGDQGSSERALEHPNCTKLTEGIALLAALAIDPERVRTQQEARHSPPPEPPEPPEATSGPSPAPAPPIALASPAAPTAASDRSPDRDRSGARFEPSVTVHGLVGGGALPSVAPGLGLELGLQRSYFEAALIVRGWAARAATVPGAPDARIDISLLSAGLRLCGVPTHRAWSLQACARADIESMAARGEGVDNARSRNPWFAALGGSLAVGYRVGRVTPRVGAELLGSPDRPRFGVLQEGVGIEAFTPKAWQIAGFVGLAYLL